MTHVVAEPCFGCKYTDCVVVCPVECFYEAESMLYIHPDECIDCEACVPECPVEAIFHEDNLPEEWKDYKQLNADLAPTCPVITEKKKPLAGSGNAGSSKSKGKRKQKNVVAKTRSKSTKASTGKSANDKNLDLTLAVPSDDDGTGIRRVDRSVPVRERQAEFRRVLLAVYGGRCAISGCDAKLALEAAHIQPYSENAPSTIANGLLLRADIHILFDCGAIRIHPKTFRVSLSQELRGTEFEEFEGVPIALPENPNHHPNGERLRYRWNMAAEIDRPE
jgi:ferredoxin